MNDAPASIRTRTRVGWTVRLVGLALALWLGLGPHSRTLLEAMVPWQASVLSALMPEFHTHRFGLVERGAQLKLSATLVNRRYIVMQGRAVAPGMGFDVETPARTGLLYPTLVLIGLAVAWPAGSARGVRARALVLGWAGALVMAVASQPLVMAGEIWGLGIGAAEEPTLAAAMVTASGFLLHGGGFALCAALVWSITRAQRPASTS